MELKPGYKLTEVGVIPEEWETLEIGALNPYVTSGSRGWAAFYSEFGALFIRITNLSRTTIQVDLSDVKFVQIASDTSEGTRTSVRDGDVLISITADIGIVAYVNHQVPKPAYINQHIALVRFSDRTATGLFVTYFLAHEVSQRVFKGLTDAGAKAGMSLRTVRKLRVALPPPAEQRAIATALSDVDALLTALDRLIAKKRDLKQAAMQELLTGKRRLPGFTGEWEVNRLDRVACIQRGASPRPIELPAWYDTSSEVGWVRISDVTASDGKHLRQTRDYLSSAGIANSRFLPTGSLIMSICATVGIPVITRIGTCIHDGFVGFTRLRGVDQVFMYYTLKRLEAAFMKMGQTGSQNNLNSNLVRVCEVAFPTIKEQEAIAAVLSDMDAEIAALEVRRAKTQQIKQGMMQELLTGRIRLVESEELAGAGVGAAVL